MVCIGRVRLRPGPSLAGARAIVERQAGGRERYGGLLGGMVPIQGKGASCEGGHACCPSFQSHKP